jgi:hypothetical protein
MLTVIAASEKPAYAIITPLVAVTRPAASASTANQRQARPSISSAAP